MKERPIIFSGPMVRAILDGQKTQTRRVVKPQPIRINDDFDGTWEWKERGHYYDDLTLAIPLKRDCPFGVPGDHLWVRETFQVMDMDGILFYAADERLEPRDWPDGLWNVDKWRPSIHMPRWASRILLEVTGVRVERVRDISEEDARAEGIEFELVEWGRHYRDYRGRPGAWFIGPRESFGTLWDSLNAKRGYGWDVNPWVWVIEFRRVNP